LEAKKKGVIPDVALVEANQTAARLYGKKNAVGKLSGVREAQKNVKGPANARSVESSKATCKLAVTGRRKRPKKNGLI